MKTCMNCEYRKGSFTWGTCLRTGEYPDIQRSYPNAQCDRNFSGWAPRRPTLLRLGAWLRSWVAAPNNEE